MKRLQLLTVFLAALILARSLRPSEAEPIRSAAEHWQLALSALESGDLRTTEIELEKLAMTTAPDQRAYSEFLRGNVNFLRAQEAEVLAARVEAGLPELDAAIAAAQAASKHWLAVVEERAHWEAARRNLQRAFERLVYLRTRRDLLKAEAKKNQPDEEAEGDAEPELIAEDRLIDADLRELPNSAIASILERLAAKDREKLQLRREALQSREATGGRDW